MAAGIYRPLDDSLRIAFTELVHWIHTDYGLSEMDAYELLSQSSHNPRSRNGGPKLRGSSQNRQEVLAAEKEVRLAVARVARR